jgi:HK97 family phage major capsid protein
MTTQTTEDYSLTNRPERRTLDVAEMRTEGKKLAGYAAVFGSLSSDLGGYQERIAPGAFTDVLASEPDVVLVLNHDEDKVLARTKSGTLTLSEDERGLAFEASLPNGPLGQDVREAVRRGDIDGASFQFVVGSEAWDDTGQLRTINRVAELYDVTVATRGAYPAAHVELRTEQTTTTQKETKMDENSTAVVEDESTATNDDEPLEERSERRAGTLRVEDAIVEQPSIESRARDAIRGIRKGEVRALTDSSSGLSPVEYANFIFDRLRAHSVLLASGARVVPTERQSEVFPQLTAAASPGWYAEGATFTEGDPTMTTITATPKKVGHIVAMSNELIDDSDPSALDVIQQNLLKIMALKFDLGAFEGTGTSNQITGLKNVSGIQVNSSLGTNGGNISSLDIISDTFELLEAANATPGAIVMHPRTWNELRELKDSYGRYQLNPSPSDGYRPQIFGVPVYISSQLSVTETQGSASTCSSIYIYQPDQVVVVLRQDVQVELDRSRLFNADQSEMRARFRADLIVPNATAVARIVGIK